MGEGADARAALDVRDALDTIWLAAWLSARPESGSAHASRADRPALGEPSASVDTAPRQPSPTAATAPASPADTPTSPGDQTSAPKSGGVFPASPPAPGAATTPARPIRIPAGSALPNGLPIVRALRPIPTRLPSRVEMELDEAATVDASASGFGIVPILRPRLERWFEAALVVDHSPSAELWAETVMEFERVLACSGVFRDVRTFRLRRTPTLQLLNESGAVLAPELLRDPSARRLIFIFTTGVSDGWTDGTFGRLLERWGSSTPVALLHALPRRLWPSTALGEPATLAVNATPGGPNSDLRKRRAWWARGRRVDPQRIPIPVLGLDPASVQRWAEMFAARRGQTAPAFLVPTEPQPDRGAARARPTSSMRERVDLFSGHAPDAFRLAVRLAVGPFTMPILRLVQSSLFGVAAAHAQAAEVMLSGFVTRITPVAADVPPEHVQFQFTPEAAAVLLESLRRDDARELAALLQGYVQQQFGTPRDQLVLLEDPTGSARLPAGVRPFKVFSDGFVEWLRRSTPRELGIATPSVENEKREFAAAAEPEAPPGPSVQTGVDPRRVLVVAVGVSTYAISSTWNVPHAAEQAVAFATWARSCGVPAERVHLFLSTADHRRLAATLANASLVARPATRDTIHRFIYEDAAVQDGDLLLCFWSGQGGVSAAGSRVLFFEDLSVGHPAGLDANALFAALRTSVFTRFATQIAFIDTSGTYLEDTGLHQVDTTLELVQRSPLRDVRQTVLFSTTPGEVAENGVFGEAVLATLNNPTLPSQLPPDSALILAAARDRATRQHPVRFDWSTSEDDTAAQATDAMTLSRTFGDPPRTGTRQLAGLRVLWVDDFPTNNDVERNGLVRLGAACDNVTSTEAALDARRSRTHDIVISDLGRADGRDAGLVLLKTLRDSGDTVPFLIYATRGLEQRDEAMALGALGSTNDWLELMPLVEQTTSGGIEFLRHYARTFDRFTSEVTDLESRRRAAILRSTLPGLLPADAAQIASGFDHATALKAFLTVLAIATRSEYMHIVRRDDTALAIVADWIGPDMAHHSTASPDGLIGRAARLLKTVWSPDVGRDPQYLNAKSSTQSELVVATTGSRYVVNIERDIPNAFSDTQIRWLEAFVHAFPFEAMTSSASPVTPQANATADGSASGFSYWFYVSNALADRNGVLSAFLVDLHEEVKKLTGDASGPGFLGIDEESPDALALAGELLTSSRVTVAIVTPAYVQSERCGREWQAARQIQQMTLGRSGALLPVIWQPPEGELPRAIESIQYPHEDLPGSYTERGLEFLSTERWPREDYWRVVQGLGRAIVRLGGELTPPDAALLPDISTLPNAFDDRRRRSEANAPATQQKILRQRDSSDQAEAPAGDGHRITVLVTTTRRGDAATGFGTERGDLRTVRTQVLIPPVHRFGQVEAPSLLRLQLRENPQKHVTVTSVEPAAEEVAWGAADTGAARDQLMYVPGFNVSFDASVSRAAVIAFDLKWAGAMTMFDWPSTSRVAGYTTDAANAAWSTESFAGMLKKYDTPRGARRHLLARDLGCRIVIDGLRQSRARLNEVVLFQPVVDADIMTRLLHELATFVDRITIYVTPVDAAFRTLQSLQGGRAFNVQDGASIEAPNVEVIGLDPDDAAFQSERFWGDVYAVLDGRPAAERFGIRRAPGGWTLGKVLPGV